MEYVTRGQGWSFEGFKLGLEKAEGEFKSPLLPLSILSKDSGGMVVEFKKPTVLLVVM